MHMRAVKSRRKTPQPQRPQTQAELASHTPLHQVCVVDYVKKEGIGVVVHDLTEAFPEDLFQQLDACRTALASVTNNAVFDVAAWCQEAVRRARTGLAAGAEAPNNKRLSMAVQTRVSTRPTLPWDDLITHFNEVNADRVSGQHGVFSGRHSFAT